MRVSQSGNNTVQGSEVAKGKGAEKAAKTEGAKKSAEAAKAARPDTTGSANPEISTKGKEMAKATQIAKGAPDVREEKIAELKKRIAEGKYKVDAEAVADKMVGEHLRSGIG